jgi:hypothetical protein
MGIILIQVIVGNLQHFSRRNCSGGTSQIFEG